MSKTNFIKSSDWNPTQIGYAKCKANPGGKGRSGLINNKRGKPIDIITPPDMLTWGAERARDADGNPLDKFAMSIQFPNENYPNEEQSRFLENIKAFEAQLVRDAKDNYTEWFPNLAGKSREVAEANIECNFVSALRYRKIPETEQFDFNSAPSMKIRLNTWDGEWKFRIYDKESHAQTFPVDDGSVEIEEAIPKMSRATAFIRCGGRWFVNNNWGYKWNLVSAVLSKSDYSSEDIDPFSDDIGIDFGPSGEKQVDNDDGIAHAVARTVDNHRDGIAVARAEVVAQSSNEPSAPEPELDPEVLNEPVAEAEPVVVAEPVQEPKKKKIIAKKK